MPAKPKPMPETLEAAHARIRTLEATMRQRLDPPCYVLYLLDRLVGQVGVSDVARTVGLPLDAETLGRWFKGQPVPRTWYTRGTVHALELRLWQISAATRARGGEEREQADESAPFRGEAFELHSSRSMAEALEWLLDYSDDVSVRSSVRRSGKAAPAPARAVEVARPVAVAAPAPAPAQAGPPLRRAARTRAELRQQLPLRFFEIEEVFVDRVAVDRVGRAALPAGRA